MENFGIFQGYVGKLGGFDYFIGIIGVGLFIFQIVIFACAIQNWTWDAHRKKNMNFVISVCELFPLLGLLGTVLGLLNTFSEISSVSQSGAGSASAIEQLLGTFAPALTTTVSGIICLIINLFMYIVFLQYLLNYIYQEGRKNG